MGEIDDSTVAGLTATLVRAFEQGDADPAPSLYEPEARLLLPGAPVLTGPDAVGDFFRRRSDVGSDGGRLPDSGTDLVVFRRPSDMWNSDAG